MSGVRITKPGTAEADHAAPSFDSACRALYENAFPPEQRLDPDVINDTASVGDRRLYMAQNQHGELRGFAVIFPIASDSVLLEYLAVDARHRSRGIGSKLFGAVCKAELGNGARAVYLEIQDTDEADLTPGERTQRRRRAVFYRRNHAHPVPARITYSPPSLAPDDSSGRQPRYVLLAHTGGAPPSFTDATMALAAIAKYSYTAPYSAPSGDLTPRQTAISPRPA